MKQILYLFMLSFFVCGCKTIGYTETYDIRNLTVGMTKSEVFSLIGPPERYLSIARTSYGYEEVLQYRNVYNELYALEFLNEYLVAADYIYEDSWSPMYPTTGRPAAGKPVFPSSYRPNQPPPQGNRPGYSTSSPGQQPDNVLPPAKPRTPVNTKPANTSKPASNNPPSSNLPGSTNRPANTNQSSTPLPSANSRETTTGNTRTTTTTTNSRETTTGNSRETTTGNSRETTTGNSRESNGSNETESSRGGR
jgi:hypothetical protein